jgi:hypothetical protein
MAGLKKELIDLFKEKVMLKRPDLRKKPPQAQGLAGRWS